MGLHDLTILTARDVESVVNDADLAVVLESQAKVFVAYSSQGSSPSNASAIQAPLRLSINTAQATTLYMPARVDGLGTACKIVTLPKGGSVDGLPTTTIVQDDDGVVRAVINARSLTALRNASGSALFLENTQTATKPKNLVIFGSGTQADFHARIILRRFPSISSCRIVVRRITDRSQSLQESLHKLLPQVDFSLHESKGATEPGQDLSTVVAEADIIVTVTPSTEALFSTSLVSPGTRLVLVGSYKPEMREVEDALIRRAGIVVVDSKTACGHEAGELISTGIKPYGMLELGEILSGQTQTTPGAGGDVILFKSVGLGIQDVAISQLVYNEAAKRGLGTVVYNYD
ncbi:hypothetical protein I316_06275 [Kwoniella heveanensis BCC8398]|uniref:Ornithine cyclodeaminase n=1 Tax=Kwoniella heveanensis BCC8398 TaxID=1296120 RepID=A0A1B9GM00_9TREE|nr:hypothetical protein I316_06275 [Kwoniella heveanensis BCC8398]